MPNTPGTTNFPASLDVELTLLELANNAETALSSGITSGATTMGVTSTTGFPPSGLLTVDNEIISYASKSSAAFNGLSRGLFGTSAGAHAGSAPVQMRFTAEHHKVLVQAILEIQQKLGFGDSVPSTPGLALLSGTAGASAWEALPASGGAPAAIETVFTTANLSAGAVQNVTLPLGARSDLIRLTTNTPAWVRFYATPEARTADATRAQTDDPQAGKGVLGEAITAAGELSWVMSPIMALSNADASRNNNIYISIKNLDSAPHPITLTLLVQPIATISAT